MDIRHDDDENECYAGEVSCWEKYKDEAEGRILNPIIDYGIMNSDNKYNRRRWLIMPKLRTIRCVIGRESCEEAYLNNKALPKLKKYDKKMQWFIDGIHSDNFGDDIHSENVGMDHRGNWYLLDYSEYIL